MIIYSLFVLCSYRARVGVLLTSVATLSVRVPFAITRATCEHKFIFRLCVAFSLALSLILILFFILPWIRYRYTYIYSKLCVEFNRSLSYRVLGVWSTTQNCIMLHRHRSFARSLSFFLAHTHRERYWHTDIHMHKPNTMVHVHSAKSHFNSFIGQNHGILNRKIKSYLNVGHFGISMQILLMRRKLI